MYNSCIWAYRNSFACLRLLCRFYQIEGQKQLLPMSGIEQVSKLYFRPGIKFLNTSIIVLCDIFDVHETATVSEHRCFTNGGI